MVFLYQSSEDLYAGYVNHLATKFRDTRDLENYTYVLTDVKAESEKGPGLVKVNKFNGKTENQIILGTREPDFLLDGFDSKLFFQPGKNKIICYDF